MERDVFHGLTPWEHFQEPLQEIQFKPKRTLFRLTIPQRASLTDLTRHSHQPSTHSQFSTKRIKKNHQRTFNRETEAQNLHKQRLDTLRKRKLRLTLKNLDDSKRTEHLYKSIDEYRKSKQGKKHVKKSKQTKIVFHNNSSQKRYCNSGLLNSVRRSQMPQNYNYYQYPINKSYFRFNRKVC